MLGSNFTVIVTTCLILLNLIFFTKMKPFLFPKNSYCAITIGLSHKDGASKDISKILKKLPIEIISENIKENPKNYQLHYIVRVPRGLGMFDLKEKIQHLIPSDHISLSENIKP